MHVRSFRSILLFIALALTLALGGAPVRAQISPTLTTDAQSYVPGDTVILIGSGFHPGESVDVSIAIDDDANNIHIGDYDWVIEQADPTGGFVTFWTVPLEALGMTLRASALGLTSAAAATTSFTDDVGSHFLIFQISETPNLFPFDGFTLTVTDPTQATTYFSGTIFFNGNPTVSIPVPAFANISFGGPPTTYIRTVAPNAGTHTYISPLPMSVVSGAPGDTTTVNLTYVFTPPCSATNTPPSLSASDLSFGDSCPASGNLTVTVTPADFNPAFGDVNGDPVALTFSDGTTSKVLVFNTLTSSHNLTLRATDNPSARNQLSCPPLQSFFVDFGVTATASVFTQPTNAAPVVSAADLVLGDYCVSSSVTIPITLGSFGASASDIDPFTLELPGGSSVTLTLPSGMSDAVVTVPVIISATDDPSARNCGVCNPVSPMTGSTTAHVTAHLHRNTAPTITAHNLCLGDVTGLLSAGQFIKTQAVTPASFGALANDPDGDPVTVTTDVASVTLVGPGIASVTVNLTATDNPSARTNGTCSAASTTHPVQVTARLVYRFDGVLAPLSNTVSTKVKRGCNVNVKFRLFDANNVQITSMLLNPAGGPTAHTIGVAFNQCNAPDGAIVIDEPGAGDDNNIDFAYSTGTWLFHLHTNNSYMLNTTYLIRIHTNDGRVHHALISIKP